MEVVYPWIQLAGRWLEEAGFTPGQRVRVNVEHGRLVITAE
jgi:toxic protein SymE